MSEADLYVTNHAGERVRQRGYRERDLALVFECGTAAGEAVILTNRDVERELEACRRRIAQLERLRGTGVFVRENAVVTVIHLTRDQVRRLLAGGSRARRGRPQRRMRRVRHARNTQAGAAHASAASTA